MDLNKLQMQLNKMMHDQNNQPIADFEGYSPAEMQSILYDTFGPQSPLQLQKLTEPEYNSIPLLNQIKYLCKTISDSGELKLTARGFLPTKIVADIYARGFLKERHIDNGIIKLYKETDSETIHLTRILAELAGLIKKRNGKLSLTKTAGKVLTNNYELIKLILVVFGTKFNWAYFDLYGENHIGQTGYGFSLILLSKYGNKKQPHSFYASKYFKAFPNLLNSVQPNFGTLEEYAADCYSIRTFDRFLDYFGLIGLEESRSGSTRNLIISKTPLFDKLIKRKSHMVF